MAKVVCENCKIEIEIPEGYDAPFLQCPDCGAIQKYNLIKKDEPKFKILTPKGRERAANKVVSTEVYEEPVEDSTQGPKLQQQQQIVEKEIRIEHEGVANIIDEEQLLLDSMGEEGLQKAFELASKYAGTTSSRRLKNGRAKAIQVLMKDKYPAELSTKAIVFAEKAPETQEIIKKKRIKFYIILALIAIAIIVALVIFI